MNSWSWLVGRRFRQGIVESVENDYVVLKGDSGYTHLSITMLLADDYRRRDRADEDMAHILNSGAGNYRP